MRLELMTPPLPWACSTTELSRHTLNCEIYFSHYPPLSRINCNITINALYYLTTKYNAGNKDEVSCLIDLALVSRMHCKFDGEKNPTANSSNILLFLSIPKELVLEVGLEPTKPEGERFTVSCHCH